MAIAVAALAASRAAAARAAPGAQRPPDEPQREVSRSRCRRSFPPASGWPQQTSFVIAVRNTGGQHDPQRRGHGLQHHVPTARAAARARRVQAFAERPRPARTSPAARARLDRRPGARPVRLQLPQPRPGRRPPPPTPTPGRSAALAPGHTAAFGWKLTAGQAPGRYIVAWQVAAELNGDAKAVLRGGRARRAGKLDRERLDQAAVNVTVQTATGQVSPHEAMSQPPSLDARPDVDPAVDRVAVDLGEFLVVRSPARSQRGDVLLELRDAARRRSAPRSPAGRAAPRRSPSAPASGRGAAAISFSARTRSTFSSVSSVSEKRCPRRTRESAGIPSRYLSVSSPWASGENAMQPTPSRSSTSSSSCSIQRLNIEYDGWWISSGVPSPAQDRAPPRRALGAVGGDPDVARLALPHRGVERAHRLLERRVGIEPVRVEDVDVVEAHPLQALVEAVEQVLARAVVAVRTGPHVLAGLGRDHQLVAERREVLAKIRPKLISARAVRRPVVVGQVEVRDAEVERPAQDRAAGRQRPVVAEVLPQPERDRRQLAGRCARSGDTRRRS